MPHPCHFSFFPLLIGFSTVASLEQVQMTREDDEEEDNSNGKIRNGATLRVALAARNTVVAHLHDGLLNPDLRIVLQAS